MSIWEFEDLEALSYAAADLIVAEARAAEPPYRIALAGGNTPKRLYEFLAAPPFSEQIDWSQVRIFWGDERWVPPSDPESNEGMARRALLDLVPIPPENIFPMYEQSDAGSGARDYESLLEREGPLDLVLLGMGDDGHTASLFPGIPELNEAWRLVVPTTSPKGVPQRISLTLPALSQAGLLIFLVAGADKHEPLARAVGDDDSVRPPSGVVSRAARRAEWFVDRAARG